MCFIWYSTFSLTFFKTSDLYLPSGFFQSLSVSRCNDFSSIPWPSIWFMLSFHWTQETWVQLMTFGSSCVFIIKLIPLMHFVLIYCDSVYIFFTWNLSSKFLFIHLFTTAPNKFTDYFFLLEDNEMQEPLRNEN